MRARMEVVFLIMVPLLLSILQAEGLMVMVPFRLRELINLKIHNRHHFATRPARLVVAYRVFRPGMEEVCAASADSIRSTAR